MEVVAALIWDGDRFLACQRPAHKPRGLMWELVGGKIEPGETGEQALIRECREELDIDISVQGVCMDTVHTYPDTTVHLTLYHGKIQRGTPTLLEHVALRWLKLSEIHQVNFCPPDLEMLERLINNDKTHNEGSHVSGAEGKACNG